MSVSALAQPPRRRNRAKRPAWSYSGLSLAQWQADSAKVRWAQTDSMFKDVVTVVTNERAAGHTTNQAGGHSEGYHLGYVRGYEAALRVLLDLAHGQTPPPSPIGDPDYPNPDL